MKYDITLKYTAELLRDITDEDLHVLLQQACHHQFELREQSSCGGRVRVALKPHLFKKVKKDIARIKTILREWCYPEVPWKK